LAQVVASHLQAPATQSSPVAQAAQAAPFLPQLAGVWDVEGTQMPLLQQPLGQLLASHTQAPPWQLWPLGQAMQAAPLVPQAVAVSLEVGMQPSAVQQPSQVEGSQAHLPPTQASPAGQAMHMLPAEPQALGDGVTQLPLVGSQQPWQLAGPQEHEWVLRSQAMPAGQSLSPLQPQVPAMQT
jgi:hypothetical protein